jgi:transposase-like protein
MSAKSNHCPSSSAKVGTVKMAYRRAGKRGGASRDAKRYTTQHCRRKQHSASEQRAARASLQQLQMAF